MGTEVWKETIDDLVSMITKSYDKPKTDHNIYNLGSGKGTSVNTLIKTMEKIANKKFSRIQYLPAPNTYVESSFLSIDRFQKEFGDTKLKSLEEGLRKIWLS